VIDRRSFVYAGALAAAGAPLVARAQKARRVPRIGLLVPGAGAAEPGFLRGLQELGYVDGKNIVIERRSADNDFSRLPALAAELVRLQPDVIATVVTQASIAAKDATSTIPIVIVAVGDPVAAGLVGNLARPGGNITGTAGLSHAAIGKQVELVREVLPRAQRLWILWNPANAVFVQQQLGEALIAASRLRMVANPAGARSIEDIERTFTAAASERPDAMLMLPDALTIANGKRITELAIANRLPLFSSTRQLAEAGTLAIYGPDLVEAGRRAAWYVQMILRGAKPGDLSIQQATKFDLVVNLKTAAAIGIDIPGSVIARADIIR
jgi:putative ABC transport system substrate-binding protein